MTNVELKRIRLELGFTQRKMAAMIGYSYYNYRNIEQGQRKMTKEFEKALFHFLNRKSKTKLESTVDWLKIRFKTLDFKTVITSVLKLKPADFFTKKKASTAILTWLPTVLFGCFIPILKRRQKLEH